MNKQKISSWLLACMCIFWQACTMDSEEKKYPDVSHIPMQVEIERADRVFFSAKSKEEIGSYLDKNMGFAVRGMGLGSYYPSQEVLSESIYNMAQNKYIDSLHQKVEEVYGDFSTQKSAFEEAFRRIKYHYPDFKAPKIYTVITGLGFDLIMADSIVVISLDYYLNGHISYRPIGHDKTFLPDYLWKRFKPDYMVAHVVKQISNRYIRTNYEDNTLIASMIAGGKSTYFCRNMLPHLPDSIIMEYTGQQLVDVNGNAQEIWAHFVENNLFFDATRQAKAKYVNEAPFVNSISQNCPGRIGVWLGWQIVNAYMEKNPTITLQELMKDTDSQRIFQQSKYKPKNVE